MARRGSTHPDGEAGRRWRRSHLQTWAGTAGQGSRHQERDREGGDVRWRLGRAGCCRRWPWRRFSSTPRPDPTILDDDRRLSLESAVVLLRGLTTDPLCLRVQSLGGEGCSLLPHGHFWIASQRVVALGRVGPTAVEVKEGLMNAIAVGDYQSFVLRRPLVDYGDAVIMPGLIDMHAHLYEPGRAEWEGFSTSTRAAAAARA